MASRVRFRVGAPEPPNMSTGNAIEQAGAEAVYYQIELTGASNRKPKTALAFNPRPLVWNGAPIILRRPLVAANPAPGCSPKATERSRSSLRRTGSPRASAATGH